MAKLSILIFILVIIASIHAIPLSFNKLNIRDADEKTITIESEEEFCGFLPRNEHQGIGASEDDAVAFCTKDTSNAPGARLFPDGFIQSAHFASEDDYVQITGRIDNSIYVNPNDGGGQYDKNAPSGAVCHGFKHFVNLVEPDSGLYCIRCCKNKKNCPLGKSTEGCEA
ncbi:16490_t:CDS:1, partial [Dentiscutata heterogama]